MASLPLVKLPDVSLRKKAAPVRLDEIETRAFQKFIDDMIQTMHEANGIGLAAVQVGDPRYVAIVDTKDGEVVLINPQITRYGLRKEKGEEGCLSVPHTWAEVRRSKYVRCAALDRHGKPQDIKATGLFARVIQHECDHLQGTLIVDRAICISQTP